MNPVVLRSLVSSKIPVYIKLPACIAIGCGGTLGVQYCMTSSSSSWGEKAATEKEGSGKGMKFEINQLSKQLAEKEQSLKTWKEMLAKQAADLKEQQVAVLSASGQKTIATTGTDSKPEQPIIDDFPFGEEEQTNKRLLTSIIYNFPPNIRSVNLHSLSFKSKINFASVSPLNFERRRLA